MKYKTVFISDIHLGSHASKSADLLSFLNESSCDNLYIVGDFVDLWALRRTHYWDQNASNVMQKLLTLSREGVNIVYIPGNHDEFCVNFFGSYGERIKICQNTIHNCLNGKRLMVMHGHEFDFVIRNIKWLALLGDIGYDILLKVNNVFQKIRPLFTTSEWSLSNYVKQVVKKTVNVIGDFENTVAHHAITSEVEGVVCGHIHCPEHKIISGIEYYNTGDWVENNTALVEHLDGRLEIIHYKPRHKK